VNVIVAQRLVRKNCTRCIVSKEASIVELQKYWSAELLGKLISLKKKSVRLYVGKGCKVCGMTGYAGRIGVYEVMVVSEKIRELIMQHADADAIQKLAVTEGMTTMVEDGIRKILSGVTTVEEVMRVTRES
jgi:type II secretory ATPase GspE/PulE/Tfp pilus assembly ATPase PilB-like protein